MTMGRAPAVFAALALSAFQAAGALATWSTNGSGSAGSAALAIPAGNVPTARASGNVVVVSWPAADFVGGAAVEGYVLQRYDAATGAAATVGPSCNMIVTNTTCTETNVPNGTWTYTDTPVQGSWVGAQSPPSSAVTPLG
jgi:hypothetical protein